MFKKTSRHSPQNDKMIFSTFSSNTKNLSLEVVVSDF